jgi:hypothetical protein
MQLRIKMNYMNVRKWLMFLMWRIVSLEKTLFIFAGEIEQ